MVTCVKDEDGKLITAVSNGNVNGNLNEFFFVGFQKKQPNSNKVKKFGHLECGKVLRI